MSFPCDIFLEKCVIFKSSMSMHVGLNFRVDIKAAPMWPIVFVELETVYTTYFEIEHK